MGFSSVSNSLDMYRKVPSDLMEGTKRGSMLSYACLMIMIGLFTFETRAFLEKRTTTDLALDSSEMPKIRMNFNITMMDLKCDYAVVDIVSALGQDQNITAHVTKWHVDAAGIRQRYSGRNRQQAEIELHDPDVHQTIEELHENGEDAVALTPETFQFALDEYQYLFVDFYANWCSHCRALAPTWELLAEVMTDVAEDIVDKREHEYNDEELEHAKKLELPVMVAKLDCVHWPDFCREQALFAYPTLRLFVDGKRWRQDYNGHRTLVDMADWLATVEAQHITALKNAGANDTIVKIHDLHERAQKRMLQLVEEAGKEPSEHLEHMITSEEAAEQEWIAEMKKRQDSLRRKFADRGQDWHDDDHPGCQIAGHLMLHRAPGNFHIQARSPAHDLNPSMTNVSHIIHHLTIGEPFAERQLTKMYEIPDNVKGNFRPMNGNVYVTNELHQAHHHYLKIISTTVEKGKINSSTKKRESSSKVPSKYNDRFTKREYKAYQILQNSQLAYYTENVVPEAKFIYDLSPIEVTYKHEKRHWYDYITSVMAIIGGTFTVFGMLEATLNVTFGRRRRRGF